jgi:hypothetical protein
MLTTTERNKIIEQTNKKIFLQQAEALLLPGINLKSC